MKLITAALLFLLTIPGLAGAQTRITRDITFVDHVGMCEDGHGGVPLPEDFALIGTIKFLIKTSEDGTQRTVDILGFDIKGKAIGMVTGVEYPFRSQSKTRSTFTLDTGNMVELIFRYNFMIPQLGYKATYSGHTTFGPDGEMNVDVRNMQSRCPTSP